MTVSYSLFDLIPGQSGVVTALEATGSMRRRLMDIGLVKGTFVTCVGVSPFGDPSAYLIRGAVIALRKKDSQTVLIH
ncbi:MAG: ferrous iron transport protein A [Clostridia bacterium]|nr:ferrous iron transport protein A [Clostridia bacterium]